MLYNLAVGTQVLRDLTLLSRIIHWTCFESYACRNVYGIIIVNRLLKAMALLQQQVMIPSGYFWYVKIFGVTIHPIIPSILPSLCWPKISGH